MWHFKHTITLDPIFKRKLGFFVFRGWHRRRFGIGCKYTEKYGGKRIAPWERSKTEFKTVGDPDPRTQWDKSRARGTSEGTSLLCRSTNEDDDEKSLLIRAFTQGLILRWLEDMNDSPIHREGSNVLFNVEFFKAIIVWELTSHLSGWWSSPFYSWSL